MPACNDNNNIKICLRFFHGEAMAQWDNRDPRVAGSNPAGQTIDLLPQSFPVLTKTICRHSSLVPRSRTIPDQSFLAQTASLLTPAFAP